jgi:hypothetical protein
LLIILKNEIKVIMTTVDVLEENIVLKAVAMVTVTVIVMMAIATAAVTVMMVAVKSWPALASSLCASSQ